MADSSVTSNNQGSLGFQDPSFQMPPGAPGLLPPAVHVEKSAGTTTVQGAVSLEESSITQADSEVSATLKGSSAHIDPSKPSQVPPNPNAELLSHEDTTEAQYNAFMGGIYAVALTELIAEILKMHMYAAKVDSVSYLNAKSVEKDIAEGIAKMQIDQGTAEMYTAFARAACAGASVGIHAAAGTASLKINPQSRTGMVMSSYTQSASSLGGSDSVFSNIASGLGASVRAHIEAQITMGQFTQKFVQDMEDRVTNDMKSQEDTIAQVLQQFMQWMNAMYQFTAKG